LYNSNSINVLVFELVLYFAVMLTTFISI